MTQVYANMLFVIRLALISMLFAVLPFYIILLWLRTCIDFGIATNQVLSFYNANRSNHEPIILFTLDKQDREWDYVYLLMYWVVTCSFFNITLWFYLNEHGKQLFGATVLSLTLTYVEVVIINHHALRLFMPVVIISCTLFSLKLSLPRSSNVPKMLVYQFLILLLGTALILAQRFFPMHKKNYSIIWFGIIAPVAREVARFLVTKCAWYLFFDASINGSSNDTNNLNRQNAWVYFAWIQICFAVYYRLSITEVSDPVLAWSFVIWQAFLEIALRLTHKRRDTWLNQILKYSQMSSHRLKRNSTIIIVPANLSQISTASDNLEETSSPIVEFKNDRATALSYFYSLVIMVEMMAEYSGISISCLLLFFWRDAPLLRKFPWYTSQPLDQSIDITNVVYFFALQIVSEFCVDTFCLTFETYKTSTMFTNLRNKKTFYLLYVFALLYGAVLGEAVIILGDDYSKCLDTNLCYCVNNGLVNKGVIDTYCKLIYPQANWTNPNFTLPLHH